MIQTANNYYLKNEHDQENASKSAQDQNSKKSGLKKLDLDEIRTPPQVNPVGNFASFTADHFPRKVINHPHIYNRYCSQLPSPTMAAQHSQKPAIHSFQLNRTSGSASSVLIGSKSHSQTIGGKQMTTSNNAHQNLSLNDLSRSPERNQNVRPILGYLNQENQIDCEDEVE